MRITRNEDLRLANGCRLVTAWKMVAEYEDGEMLYFHGDNEDECMVEISNKEEIHGKCTWYSGYSDEDYVDGEYVGRENFIFDV